MATKKKLLQAAAGTAAAGGEALNVEDVFSTYLYDGTGSAQTITNGIDLDGEGGAILTKRRDSSSGGGPWFNDTERGITKYISTSDTSAEVNNSSSISAVTSSGYTLGTFTGWNNSAGEYASWTFRKAPKFFDVVTYTGDGVAGRRINHNLGVEPACIILKRTNTTETWVIYHRGIDATAPEDYYIRFDTGARTGPTSVWNYETHTDTNFVVDADSMVNGSGSTYVAYLFAHNDGDGEFGPTGDQDIIKCGTIVPSTSTVVDLGWEPQWILVKSTTNADDWYIFDTMRGLLGDFSGLNYLEANTSLAEQTGGTTTKITPTGFEFNYGAGQTYIYIAIRRGPMAVPESATDVFAVKTKGSAGDGVAPAYRSGFPVDAAIIRRELNTTEETRILSRLTGVNYLRTYSTSSEGSDGGYVVDFMDGWNIDTNTDTNRISWMWKRAPNFFDVVTYTGNGTAGRTVSHNLGVAPEMMWVKHRASSVNWNVYHKDLDATNPSHKYLMLDSTDGVADNVNRWNDTEPTESVFSVGTSGGTNVSGGTYIAYLFASLDGVSKVGSINHTSGVDTNVDCGFSNGARFVLWKQTDAANSWGVVDVERGLVSGNDALLLLNSTNAETSSYDLIDPLSSGFVFTGAFGTGSYIFYAIA